MRRPANRAAVSAATTIRANAPKRSGASAKNGRATFDEWLRNFDDVLFTGQQYLKGGDAAAARECLEIALALKPHDVNALNLCGMANFHAGKIERAEQLVALALQRAPGSRALQENLALIQSRTRGGGALTWVCSIGCSANVEVGRNISSTIRRCRSCRS